MKKEIILALKKKGKESLFNDERHYIMKYLVKMAMDNDTFLQNYLSLDPLNKAEWMADHLILLAEMGKI